MNPKLEIFGGICNKLHMKLSIPKTISTLFGKETMGNRNPIFKISNQSRSLKNIITYLGISIVILIGWNNCTTFEIKS